MNCNNDKNQPPKTRTLSSVERERKREREREEKRGLRSSTAGFI